MLYENKAHTKTVRLIQPVYPKMLIVWWNVSEPWFSIVTHKLHFPTVSTEWDILLPSFPLSLFFFISTLIIPCPFHQTIHPSTVGKLVYIPSDGCRRFAPFIQNTATVTLRNVINSTYWSKIAILINVHGGLILFQWKKLASCATYIYDFGSQWDT